MPTSKLYSSRFGRLVLVCLSLSVLWTPAHCKYYTDRFGSLSSLHRPWSRMDHDASLEYASSEHSPSYSRITDAKNRYPSFDSAESPDKPKEWYLTAATKKVPMEDKRFKKIVAPFYTVTDRDSPKYRDMVMKSGAPYCEEISRRRSDMDANAKDSMTCYKCRNPKNGATYEQCSYTSQPLSDSSNIDEVMLPGPGFRSRRSNSEESETGSGIGARYRDSGSEYKSQDSPYRFNEKLFSDASEDVPAEYKNKNEECEKVMRDSMMCMVCRDTKSNAKYEQCSYVRQPSEKRYAYSKSSSFKNPEREEASEKEDQEVKRADKESSDSKPVREYSDSEYSKQEADREPSEDAEETSSNCKKVQKDSQTCTVCRDPKTGGNYEKCSYAYEPNDKVYKYSRSKSYGQPRDSTSTSKGSDSSKGHDGGKSSEKSRSEPEDYHKDYSIPESFYEKYQSSPSSSYFKDEEPRSSGTSRSASDDEEYLSDYDRSKSESEKVTKSMEASSCKEVQRDSMLCKVCKDPKTGNTAEQCSYNYQPKDKSYSYSKSKSFGSPTETEDGAEDESEKKESREPSYESRGYEYPAEKRSYVTDGGSDKEFSASSRHAGAEAREESSTAAPKKVDVDFYDAFKKKAEIQKVLQDFHKEDRSKCKKLIRNKMTCYQCLDEKGFQKEECAFVTAGEPAEDRSDNRELKEYRVEPTKKVPRSILTSEDPAEDRSTPLEPEISASEKVYSKPEKSSGEQSSGEQGTSREVEPYEYVAETRPVFDRVLGFTLPAYMLSTSEHEEEFDKIVSSRI